MCYFSLNDQSFVIPDDSRRVALAWPMAMSFARSRKISMLSFCFLDLSSEVLFLVLDLRNA